MRLQGRYALATALVALTVATPASATFPGKNGDITFNRFLERDGQIAVNLFSVAPDGRDLSQITALGFGTLSLLSDHSPDGRTLAFEFQIEGDGPPGEIWLTDADGGHARPLTAFPDGVYDPAFSPDGHLLAVSSDLGGAEGIFLIPARTLGRPWTGALSYRVTRVTDGGFDSEPQFSPDGRWIVFTRYSVECTDGATYERCETRIFRVRTSGRDLQQLTDPQLNASAPDFHPSGRWIAFDTADNRSGPGVGHIVVANADGSGQRIIARGDADSYTTTRPSRPTGVRSHSRTGRSNPTAAT